MSTAHGNDDTIVRPEGKLSPVISVVNLRKMYKLGDQDITALDGITFNVFPGEFVTIRGPSGCGKSTLLHMITLMDKPDSGTIEINGENVSGLNKKQQALIRAKNIGFVFQDFNLIDHLTAQENVEIAVGAAGERKSSVRREKAVEALKRFSLQDRLKNRPIQMSGGQKQRVAIARALVNDPGIIVADEPTGNLDSKNVKMVLDLLTELNQVDGRTVIIVTHEDDVSRIGTRKIMMSDYKIISDTGSKIGA